MTRDQTSAAPAPPTTDAAKVNWLIGSLHLLTLGAFAVGQPVLDLLGRQPAFFTVRRSLPLEVVAQALFWTLAPGLVLAVGGWLVWKLAPRVYPAYLKASVAALAALFLSPVLNARLSLATLAFLGVATLFGIACAAAYARWQPVRLLLTMASLALLVFPAVFLLRPAMQKLVWAESPVVTPIASQPPALPIVLIVFDELPLSSLLDGPTSIDAIRYPAFASLAAQSTWYRNTATVSDFTIQAVPSILTGRYPIPEALPILPDHPDNLFTLMGYPGAVNISEAVTNLCPPSVCGAEARAGWLSRSRALTRDIGLVALHLVAPESLARQLPPVDQNWVFFDDEEDQKADWQRRVRSDREHQFDDFLAAVGAAPSELQEGQQEEQQQVLHMLHVVQPHPPFDRLPSGHRYSLNPSAIGVVADRNVRDVGAVLRSYQRHLLQVGYADRLLGQILERLKSAGIFDQALIVITADHGASFRPRSWRRHYSPHTVENIAAIPLLIKAPGQARGVIDERLAETVDILPTIAAHAGVEIPWSIDGRSLIDGEKRQVARLYPLRSGSQEFVVLESGFADLAGFVTRKNELLGTGGEQPVPLVEKRFLPWLGKPATELAGQPSEIRLASLQLLKNQLYLEPNPAFVPCHVTGELQLPDGHDGKGLDLMVAINGKVAGGGRVLAPFEDLAPGNFTLLFHDGFFQPGNNTFELFELRPGGGSQGPELAAIASAADLSDNLLLARNGVIRWQGIYDLQTWPGVGPMRWTDGHATFELPPTFGRRVRKLRLGLISSGPDGSHLRILIDGKQVLSRKIPVLPEDQVWPIEIDLTELAEVSRIEVVSDSFVPKERFRNSPDERRLGVGLTELILAVGD